MTKKSSDSKLPLRGLGAASLRLGAIIGLAGMLLVFLGTSNKSPSSVSTGWTMAAVGLVIVLISLAALYRPSIRKRRNHPDRTSKTGLLAKAVRQNISGRNEITLALSTSGNRDFDRFKGAVYTIIGLALIVYVLYYSLFGGYPTCACPSHATGYNPVRSFFPFVAFIFLTSLTVIGVVFVVLGYYTTTYGGYAGKRFGLGQKQVRAEGV